MSTRLYVPAIITITALIFGCGDGSNSSGVRPVASQCEWSVSEIPDPSVGVRFPSQLDIHAAYTLYFFRVPSETPNLAIKFNGEFPFAAYMGYAVYDSATGYLREAMVDHTIEPDPGSKNPFIVGNEVNTPNRSYTVVLRPNGSNPEDNPQFSNQIELPIPTGEPIRQGFDIWLRTYGPNEDKDRRGGVALPSITAFDWETGESLDCPPRRLEWPGFTSYSTGGPPPDEESGHVYFTRPPAYTTPFTDGTEALDPETDCTGYLMAELGRGEALRALTTVVHIHKVPEIWNNSEVAPESDTLFELDPVRYASLGSYGVPDLPYQNLAAYDMRKLTDGGAAFYLAPRAVPEQTRQLIEYMAETRGYNNLPTGSRLRVVPPFIVYRNKIVDPDFEGNILNVRCNPARPWNQTPVQNPDGSPSDFVPNPGNMGDYWIEATQCSLEDLLNAKPGSACAPENGEVTPPSFPAIPIPMQRDAEDVPEFIGFPASPVSIPAESIPEHPYMAANGVSNIHMDGYMSDTYRTGGPLGHSPEVKSSLLTGECATATFDSKGRIVTVCPGPFVDLLYMVDPESLDALAILRLPRRGILLREGFGAGGYFYLDNMDRAVIPTAERSIWVVGVDDSGFRPEFRREKTYDLSALIPEDQSVVSALPDAGGLIWFSSSGGIIGTIQPESGEIRSIQLGGMAPEPISKSFAVDPDPDRGGVFIVTDYALYRFDAAPDGVPEITWREAYNRGTRKKPGQTQQGSGTTPTLMGDQYVTIANNADPRMEILVFRRDKEVSGQRRVCQIPVFKEGRSATENSLIATERSIIVENNYGYRTFTSAMFGKTTEPGITRIDIDSNAQRCSVAWTSNESVPNVVSQLSLENGLLYTYTKPAGPNQTNPWYFTAIDFESGQTVYKQLTGTGFLYDSHYAAVYLGPDGRTAYVGVTGGIVAIRDEFVP